MHRLEYAIVTISGLLEKHPEKYKELAYRLKTLAGCTHGMADDPNHVSFEEWVIDLEKAVGKA